MTRVIAGSLRGRSLATPEGMATRPTMDRVKEALFGSIQFEVPGKSFLDLFSGSGGIGIEALSRGASRVDLVEMGREPVAVIRQNLKNLGITDRCFLHAASCESALNGFAAMRRTFDIIFMDPPYHEGLEEKIGQMVSDLGLLSPGGLLIVESASDTEVEIQGLTKTKVKTYKTARLSYFRAGGEETP